MLDWQTGEVNAKYWVTKLLATTVGDNQEKTVVASEISVTQSRRGIENVTSSLPVYVMPYKKQQQKGMLIVNKKATALALTIDGSAQGGVATVVEVNTDTSCTDPGFEPPVRRLVSSNGMLRLGPFAVAVVDFP